MEYVDWGQSSLNSGAGDKGGSKKGEGAAKEQGAGTGVRHKGGSRGRGHTITWHMGSPA